MYQCMLMCWLNCLYIICVSSSFCSVLCFGLMFCGCFNNKIAKGGCSGCVKSRAGKGQSTGKDRRTRKPPYKESLQNANASRNLLVSYPMTSHSSIHFQLETRTLHLQHIYVMQRNDIPVGRALIMFCLWLL